MRTALAVAVAVFSSLVVWIGSLYLNSESPCKDDPPLDIPLVVSSLPQADAAETPYTRRVYPCEAFSETYSQARNRFLEAARTLQESYQLRVSNQTISFDSLTVMEDEQQGQKYTIDIVVIPGNQPGLTFSSSGVHGVEGYAGSAVQIAFLQLLRQFLRDGQLVLFPTIVLIHAVNPVGMARYRRFNENNVDLNRNGLQPDEWKSSYVTHNGNRKNYDRFSVLFFNPRQAPTRWSAGMGYYIQAAMALWRYGLPRLKEAMVRGQYHDPSGIFYGGREKVETSLELIRDWLINFLQKRKETMPERDVVTWIDCHTGLGAFGVDTLLMGTTHGLDGAETAAHMEYYFPGAQHPESNKDGSSVAQGYEQVKGSTKDFVAPLFVDEQRALVATQEFGTLHNVFVGRAMILENAAYHYLPPDEALEWAKRTTKNAFYPQSPVWRQRILERGVRVLVQAMQRSAQLSKSKSID